MSSTPVPPKQDVPKELWAVVTTLSDDAQNAALRKCKELGFDTNKGMVSLEETLINMSAARDILLDAVDKGKLTQLPLKVQYSLLNQSRRVADVLTALVNGTDAVVNLVESVEDLTVSIWQFNLHNLSGEVLGFHNKMNQLKSQETRIRQVSREAEEFASLRESAKQTLGQISEIATAAGVQKTSLQASTDEVSAILAKATEQGQKVSIVETQVEQHGTTTTQLLAVSKQAAADTEAIANKSKELQLEIEATRSSLQALTSNAQELLASTQAASSSQLQEFNTKYEELSTSTQAVTSTLATKLDTSIAELTAATDTKVDSAAAALQRTGTELENKVTQFMADSSSRLTQVETAQETRLAAHVKDFAEDTQVQMKSQAETFNAQTTDLASKAEESIKTGEVAYKQLVDQLGDLEGQIRESIERATGHSLFHSFQKRQLDIAKAKRFWASALGALVAVSLCLSLGFIWYLHYVQVYNAAFYLKLSISIPIVYAIAFCNVQYSRERRLEEEYAFKSSISISLDPYQKLVGNLVDKSKPEELSKYTAFIIDSVNRVFTSPTGEIFESPGDRSSAEKLIKSLGDFIEPLLKVLKK
jgi:hypothetical protein